MVQTVDREHSKGQWMVQVIHQRAMDGASDASGMI